MPSTSSPSSNSTSNTTTSNPTPRPVVVATTEAPTARQRSSTRVGRLSSLRVMIPRIPEDSLGRVQRRGHQGPTTAVVSPSTTAEIRRRVMSASISASAPNSALTTSSRTNTPTSTEANPPRTHASTAARELSREREHRHEMTMRLLRSLRDQQQRIREEIRRTESESRITRPPTVGTVEPASPFLPPQPNPTLSSAVRAAALQTPSPSTTERNALRVRLAADFQERAMAGARSTGSLDFPAYLAYPSVFLDSPWRNTPIATPTSSSAAASPSTPTYAFPAPTEATGLDTSFNLEELLHCPICFDIARPPIFQCLNGHNVCGSCRSRLSSSSNYRSCPLCRQVTPPGMRNRALETLYNSTKFACQWKAQGCAENIRGDMYDDHVKDCTHRPFKCTLSNDKKQCTDTLCNTVDDLLAHLLGEHEIPTLIVGDCATHIEKLDRTDIEIPLVLWELDGQFFLETVTIANKFMHMRLLTFGKPADAEKFDAEVEVLRKSDNGGPNVRKAILPMGVRSFHDLMAPASNDDVPFTYAEHSFKETVTRLNNTTRERCWITKVQISKEKEDESSTVESPSSPTQLARLEQIPTMPMSEAGVGGHAILYASALSGEPEHMEIILDDE